MPQHHPRYLSSRNRDPIQWPALPAVSKDCPSLSRLFISARRSRYPSRSTVAPSQILFKAYSPSGQDPFTDSKAFPSLSRLLPRLFLLKCRVPCFPTQLNFHPETICLAFPPRTTSSTTAASTSPTTHPENLQTVPPSSKIPTQTKFTTAMILSLVVPSTTSTHGSRTGRRDVERAADRACRSEHASTHLGFGDTREPHPRTMCLCSDTTRWLSRKLRRRVGG